MTNEERDLIVQFITRVGGGAPSAGFGSVPQAGGNAALPPVDPEADALIGDLFNRNPEARYRITQLAFVQEHALAAAQGKINELTQALTQARQQQASQGASPQGGSPWGGAPAQPQQRGGFFSSLFGGGGTPMPQPRPQQYAPPPQYAPQPYAQMPPQMAAQQGSGFLGGALRTAAGVAGGVVAGNALMNLFSGHSGFGGGGFGAPTGFAEAIPVVPETEASGWGGGGSGIDPYDQGGAMKDDGSAPDKFADGGVVDNSSWTNTDQSGGWTDASNTGDSGGGWTDSSDSGGGGGWDDTSNS